MTKAPQEAKRLGRPPKWSERTPVRFAEGTFNRIALVLRDGEDRSDLIRSAVDREIERREAQVNETQP